MTTFCFDILRDNSAFSKYCNIFNSILYFSMKEGDITKFFVSISGRIEYVTFPAGVFDEEVYIQYDTVWGPDWEVVSGLTNATSQVATAGDDPDRVVINMPVDILFSSTNVSGWPQLIITVRGINWRGVDSVQGYALVLTPPTAGERVVEAPLLRLKSSTVLGEWISWFTGQYPELADPKMMANGKDNYLFKTEAYGSVTVNLSMISKDLHKLGYDNQSVSTKPNAW